jgi:imidazoleglycerol-phosphate dehydratase
MLELFARHGRFDIICYAEGDVHVDYHHLVEDTGIMLGRGFRSALGDMRGIVRYGSFTLPMDEALVMAAVDISGRAHLGYEVNILAQKVGSFDTELVEEFLLAFARELGASIHIRQLAGKNAHHIIEAIFKGLARAMAQAVAIDEQFADEVPSTKGTIL